MKELYGETQKKIIRIKIPIKCSTIDKIKSIMHIAPLIFIIAFLLFALGVFLRWVYHIMCGGVGFTTDSGVLLQMVVCGIITVILGFGDIYYEDKIELKLEYKPEK